MQEKKNPEESCQEHFLPPKNKFLKTGIGNLGGGGDDRGMHRQQSATMTAVATMTAAATTTAT